MFEAVYLGATFSDGFRIYNRVELPSFNQTTRAVHESPCDHASESWLLVHFTAYVTNSPLELLKRWIGRAANRHPVKDLLCY